jgi:metallophosphoesterase (TIGR03767 family)
MHRALPSLAAFVVLASSASAAQKTTLDQTLTGDGAAAYSTLTTGPGWARVVRDDLAGAGSARAGERRSLLYFAQLSDFQLADEESPARVEFLDVDGTPFTAAWRPQEALEPFIVDRVVRAVNAFGVSPLADSTGEHAQLAFTLTTGDSADSMQRNEVKWVVRLLEGGPLDPNSGADGTTPRYTGVQDYDDYLEDGYFYDPDQPQGRHAAWPRYPGLMDRAQRLFDAAGLDAPSYVTFGNHDGLVQGNAMANAGYEAIATGPLKVMGPVPLEELTPSFLQTTPTQVVQVPADPDRQYVDHAQYRALHATGHQADAHGFGYIEPAEAAASNGAADYYAFRPKPGFTFISLDTVSEAGIPGPSANGNIDDPQFRWLTRKITEAEARGDLIVVFGHHPIRSLNVRLADELALPCLLNDLHGHGINPGCDRDPRSSRPIHVGAELQALLLAHPHVVAYVAGHTHEHKITAFKRAGGGGFWGIETASETDWPVQSRLLEIMDNEDGTLSIFGTLIDHLGPVATPPSGTSAGAFAPGVLAAIGRTFSFNDFQLGGGTGIGLPTDRNVELLVPDPR